MNSQNCRGRSNLEENRNRSDIRNFRNKERSYGRDRDNRAKFNINRSMKDSRSRSTGRVTSRDKSKEMRCHCCRKPGHLIREC